MHFEYAYECISGSDSEYTYKTIPKKLKLVVIIIMIYIYTYIDLERLKRNAVNKTRIYLIKITMKPLATEIGILSQDVKLFMILHPSNRYYASNERTIISY